VLKPYGNKPRAVFVLGIRTSLIKDLDIPQQEQDQMLAALRRSRYGSLLAVHILLLCTAGHNPTAIEDTTRDRERAVEPASSRPLVLVVEDDPNSFPLPIYQA
jgi:DNA-binding transcriptional MocR family regulator